MIILGLDPGLGTTGWGVIHADGNRLRHIANGQIKTDPSMPCPVACRTCMRRWST